MKSVINNTVKPNVKKTRGDFGENAVSYYLIERGFEIIARNYCKRQGEIDIIAVHNGVIIFIEVKTRKFGSLTDGVDAITREKQQKIVKTARAFLGENPQFRGKNTRFDAAQVIVTTDDIPQLIGIDYYEDAFDPALW